MKESLKETSKLFLSLIIVLASMVITGYLTHLICLIFTTNVIIHTVAIGIVCIFTLFLMTTYTHKKLIK